MEQSRKKLLLTTAFAGVILIFALAVVPPSLIRMTLSLPLILFFPGYGVTAMLFRGRGLDLPTRLLLSVGLSLALTALSGLLLHLTPWGIALNNPWLLVLMCVPGLVGLGSLIRDILNISRTTTLPRIGFNPRQVLILVFAAAIATIAMNLARTPVSPKNLTGYTLLWVQPENVTDRLVLGVQSEEFQTTKYQLRFESDQFLRQGPTFELRPGETWEYFLTLDDESLTEQPITILLYRLDKPDDVYRRVVWWNENN